MQRSRLLVTDAAELPPRQATGSLIMTLGRKMLGENPFATDPDHPIPDTETCDVHVVRKEGGADLMIVIHKPMMDDARSRARLIRKIERYLGFITSDQFREECREPSTSNTSITIHIHPESSPAIFTLIEKCAGWIEDNSAELRIKKLA